MDFNRQVRRNVVIIHATLVGKARCVDLLYHAYEGLFDVDICFGRCLDERKVSESMFFLKDAYVNVLTLTTYNHLSLANSMPSSTVTSLRLIRNLSHLIAIAAKIT